MSTTPAEPDEPLPYVVARAAERLALDDRLGSLDVRFDVVGHRVFVTGMVTTEERRDVAGALLAEEMPGFEVHNELVVVEAGEVGEGDVERLS